MMVSRFLKYFQFTITGLAVSLCFIAEAQIPIVHFKLNGNAEDNATNKNNGVIMGGVSITKDRFGNPCGAMSFNGKDGYIEVPNSPTLEAVSNKFSVSAWFYIPKTAQNSVMRDLTLICKGDQSSETSSNPQYRVQILQMQNQSTISVNTAFTKNDNNFRNHLIEFDKWSFVCLTYDGVEVKTFLNGSLVWSMPYSGVLERNNSSLHIGKDMPGGMEFFRGALDDLRIYNESLTSQQVLSLLNDNSGSDFDEEFSMQCPPNMIAYTSKSNCSAPVNFKPPTITSYCGTPVTKQVAGPLSGSEFPLGSTNIAYLTDGAYHLQTTCDFSVTVKDKIAPEIKCNTDTTIRASSGSDGVAFSYQLPLATDNCAVAEVKLMEGLKCNTVFPIGNTILKFEARDKSGNAAECSYNVIVTGTAPVSLQIDTPEVEAVAAVKPEVKNNKTEKVGNDSVYYEHELTFKDCTITVVMYDDGEEDNDTVSLYFNGRIVVDYQMLKLKANNPIVKALVLNPDEINMLASKAWNLGKVPPNTLKIEFYEGNLSHDLKAIKKKRPVAVKVIHSRPGLAGAIKLQCKL